jgi:hypothetical protein
MPSGQVTTGSRGPVAVRLSSIPGGGLEKSQPGSIPGMTTAADEDLGPRVCLP